MLGDSVTGIGAGDVAFLGGVTVLVDDAPKPTVDARHSAAPVAIADAKRTVFISFPYF
ncbi:MAG TPA: hypothetical protein VIG55_01370 [Methylosinus sp.]|jgi:hypothetical protein